jgi:hypothetical protein
MTIINSSKHESDSTCLICKKKKVMGHVEPVQKWQEPLLLLRNNYLFILFTATQCGTHA